MYLSYDSFDLLIQLLIINKGVLSATKHDGGCTKEALVTPLPRMIQLWYILLSKILLF